MPEKNRGKFIAAILALLGGLLVCAGLLMAGLHYAQLPDAAVGTPPGDSAMDRAFEGVRRDGQDVVAKVKGEAPQERVVEAPVPDATYDESSPVTHSASVDVAAVSAEAQGQPGRVLAPTEGVDVEYSPAGAEGGSLVLPEAPGAVWYDQTAPVGEAGTTLIAGHVNYPDLSLSPFSRIAGLDKGAPVLVTDAQGVVHEYTVDSLQLYEQQPLSEELLGADAGDRLMLVTCSGASISAGGAWSYEYNLVVTASAA